MSLPSSVGDDQILGLSPPKTTPIAKANKMNVKTGKVGASQTPFFGAETVGRPDPDPDQLISEYIVISQIVPDLRSYHRGFRRSHTEQAHNH